jgi:hypothetical protein
VADQEIAYFSKDNAKIILEVVRYLRANGFIMKPPTGAGQFIPPAAPIYVRNDSGVAVPPFACLQATGTVEVGGQNYITVDQPADTTGEAGAYLFNGQEEIAASGDQRYGIAHDGPLCRMLTNGAAMTGGDKARPVVNQWYIELGGELFTIVGDDDIAADVVRGVIGGGGGGGATLYRFETTAAYTSGTSVAATIKTMAGTTFASGATLKDPEAIFLGMASGTKGYCIEQGGEYFAYQAACNAEEGYV